MGDTLRLARVGEEILKCSYWRGANERVANYLELPNNLMTFLQKNILVMNHKFTYQKNQYIAIK